MTNERVSEPSSRRQAHERRSRPKSVRIEAMAACQLRCPSCPTATGAIRPAIRSGYLKAADFARLLDDNPSLRHVELSNYGEMFLSPELTDVLRVAFERGVTLSADNGVNLNRASDEQLEALVRYGVLRMTCSIDGATRESYARYRVGGDLDAVLANVRTINRFKAKHRSKLPVLTWQLVVFGHNQDELPRARALASELGMRFKPKLSWDDEVSPVRDHELVRIQAGLPATRKAYREEYGVDYIRPCHQLWNEPVLNWDGTVLGCCRNFWGDFGKGALTDLEGALDGERMRAAKAMLIGDAPPRDDVPCSTCDVYLEMKRDGSYLSLDEVRLKQHARAVVARLSRLSPRLVTALQRRLGRSALKRWALWFMRGHRRARR